MAYLDHHNKQPGVEYLPDGRLRITRVYDVAEYIDTPDELTAHVWLAWGTADTGGKTAADNFPACRLVKQDVVAPTDKHGALLVRVFEEIPATGEIQVGKNTKVIGEDGRITVIAEFLQLSSGTATPGTVGTSTPPAPDAAVGVMQKEEAQNDGTLRRIKRTYISAGILAQSTDYGNNGAMETRSITYYNGTPSTPAGFTLVGTSEQNPGGLPGRTYRFAKGVGMISREIETKFDGGLVITSETWLTAAGDAPAALTGEFSRDYKEADGHRVWSLRGAVGDGIVEDNTQTRYGGKLSIRTVTSIGTAVHASGEISFSTDARDGYTLYTSRGVSGAGRFSTATSSSHGGAITKTVIRFIDTDDTAKPSGAITSTETDQQEGYSVITEVYTHVPSPGATASTEVTTRHNGALTLTTLTSFNAPPTGVGVIIRSETTQGDGFTTYSRTYATGTGEINTQTDAVLSGHVDRVTVTAIGSIGSVPAGGVVSSTETTEADGYTLFRTSYTVVTDADLPDEVTTKHNGALTLTTKRKINATPTGTGVLVRTDTQVGSGYTIYASTYADGTGEINTQTDAVLSGHVDRVTVTAIGSIGSVPAGGVVSSTETTEADGYTLFRTSYTVVTDADLPDEVTTKHNGALTLTTKRKINATPTGTGVLIRTSSNPGSGFTIYESVYASGTGVVDTNTRSGLNSTLTTTTIRSINVAPSSPGGGFVQLINTQASEADGYELYEYTWVSGSGVVNTTTDTRADGSVITSVTVLNDPSLGTGAGYLTGQDVKLADGYVVYVKTYYAPPSGYTVPGVQVVRKPGVMAVTTDGPTPTRAPEVVAVTTSIAVTFTATPAVGTFTPIKGGCIVYENVTFDDETTLNTSSAFGSDYYSDDTVLTGSGGTYRGKDVDTYACNVYGAADQAGATITFNYDAVPFFASGAVVIYKQTIETGVL